MNTFSKLFSVTLIAFCLSLTSAFAQISFTMSTTQGCAPLSVTFTNTSTVGASYYIFFDDGTGDFLIGSDTTHIYNGPGYYFINLYAYDSTGAYIGFASNGLQVDAAVNNFYQSATSVCPGGDVQFSAQSGTSWFWDYGDGDTASGQWTWHAYAAFGTYNVTLVTNGICGIDTIVQPVSVDSSGVPDGNFGFWPDPVCPLQPVTYYAYDPSGISFVWDFGDGDSSNIDYPSNTYDSVGFYNITLIITNGCGNSATASDTIEVKENAAWPFMNINFNENPVCPQQSVRSFAPGNFLAYVWNAGDGSPADSMTDDYFDHVYLDTGTYIQTVKIYNFCGGDTTISDTVVVNMSVGLPNQPWFEIDMAEEVCPGEEVRIDMPGGFMAYILDYGDGSPGDSLTWSWAEHTYNDTGEYVLSVQIFNFCGLDSTIYDTIVVNDSAGFQPGVQIWSNSPICPGNAGFQGPQGMAMYVWDFGDGSPVDSIIDGDDGIGHAYPDTGSYVISLTIVNYCGLDTTLYDTLIVGNNVGFPMNMYAFAYPNPVCPGDRVSINTEYGYESYEWNFGDGNSITTGEQYALNYYDSLGAYNYSVKITNGCGLDTTISGGILVDANAPIPPQVELDLESNVICPGDMINFRVNDEWAWFFWDFGGNDTVTTTQGSINRIYDSVGTYDMSVTIYNGCGNQLTISETIVVDSNNTFVDASIMALNKNVCVGDLISVGPATEGNGGTSYLYYWDLGDGSVDTTQGTGINHSYSDTGVYTINVTATNGCGYSASSTVTITVSDNAYPYLGPPGSDGFFGVAGNGGIAGCPGDVILFYFGGQGQNLWEFGDGSSGSATSTIQTAFGAFAGITHVYQDTGSYWAKLTLTNGCGNSITDSVLVVIGSGLAVAGEFFAESPVGGGAFTTCQGVGFLAMGGTSYVWDYGDGETLTTNSSQVTHFYDSAGTYNVTVTMTNSCGNSASYIQQITVIDGGGATATASVSSSLTCNGGSDAMATASGTGGTLPYTYMWNDPTAQTTASAGNLSAGTYSVTVSDMVGCTGIATVTVSDPAAMTGTGAMTPASCAATDGTVSITSIIGGTAPYSLVWSNGDTSATADSLASGTYTVTVTDANGCVNSQAVTLNDVSGVTLAADTIVHATCNGSSDGSVSLVASGGTAPYTFIWSNGDTIEDISGLKEGTYTVTVTDAAGCNTIQSGTITEPDAIALATTIVDANCGVADGSISAAASGGTGAYAYAWSNGDTTSMISSLVAGAYNLTVTDGNSCTAVYTITVSNANAPAITSVVSNVSCNGMNDGSIDLSVTGGTTPYTYLWLHDGSFTQDVSGLSPSSITMILYDGGGCQTAQTFTITEPDVLAVSTSSTGARCGYSDGSATATATGGTTPYNYSWSTGGSNSAEAAIGLGTTVITITDTNGCTATDSAIVSTLVDDVSICVVTVDTTSTMNVIVWDKPSPAMGIESFNIYRDIVGTYTLVGNVAYNALSEFEDTTSGINPNTTSYRYKISALDSCSNEGNQSAFHETIHMIPVVITGGDATILWDNYEGFNFAYYRIMRDITDLGGTNWVAIDSVTNANFTYVDLNAPNVSTLRYRIDVVTAAACVAAKVKNYNSSKSNTAAINNKTPLVYAVTQTDANQGNCNGTATITVTEGTPPYTYVWSDSLSQSTATATGLCPGNYSVVVYDADGDSVNGSTAIGTILALAASTTTTDATQGNCDGTATVAASNGTSPYTYLWSDGTSQTTVTAVGLCAGSYTVTVYDAGGDSIVVSASVGAPAMASTATSTDASFATCNGTATVTASGGVPPYTYIWDDGSAQTTATANSLCGGTYNVTVFDALGDSSVTSATVNILSGIVEFDLSQHLVIYPNPNTGHFSILITGLDLELLTMRIYTMEGQLIMEKNLPSIAGELHEDLDISDAGPGVYYVQVISAEGTSVKKVLVQ